MADSTLLFLGLFSAIYAVAIIAAIGSTAGKQGGLTEFFVSGRDIGLGTAIATLGATEIGLITIAYNAQKGFNEGFAAFHIGLAALVGCAHRRRDGFRCKTDTTNGRADAPRNIMNTAMAVMFASLVPSSWHWAAS